MIDAAWEGIERWAHDHFPELAESLCAGASEAAIEELEAKLGRALPSDLCASLARHDGQRRLPHHRGPAGLMWVNDVYSLLSVERILDETRAWSAIAARDPVPAGTWAADRIAVAASGSGDVIAIDRASGRLDVVVHDEEEPSSELAPGTFGRWLQELAADLARGRWRVSEWRSLEPNVPRLELFDVARAIAARSKGAEDVWSELARRYDQRAWIVRRLVPRDYVEAALRTAP